MNNNGFMNYAIKIFDNGKWINGKVIGKAELDLNIKLADKTEFTMYLIEQGNAQYYVTKKELLNKGLYNLKP